MITDEQKYMNRVSWVRELNKLDKSNKEIADQTGLSVIEVSKILLNEKD